MTEPAPEPAAAGGGGGEALSRTNTGALSRTASALASALDISAEDVSKVQAAMPAYSIQHLHRTLENFALEAGGDGTIDKAAFTAKLAETAGEENPALLAFSASMFEQFDTDSSGRIDSVEYHLSLAALCRGSSASKNAFIFECLDKDKSGSISFEQFFSFFKSTLAAVGRVNLAKKMGLNEDNPLYTMFAMQQIEAEKKEAEQVFAAIDKDSDGLISREEFLAALAKPATLGSPHLKAVVDLLKMFTEDDDDDAEAGEGGAEPEPEPVAAAAAAMEQPEPESEPVSVPQVDLAGFTHQIGKYLFNAEGEDALGEGGFGRVFRATNSETAEEVAIKIALEQRHTPHQLREVILQACLAHEHIVPIQDIVYDSIIKLRSGGAAVRAKQLVVVMEKVDGGELFDEVMAVHGMDEGTAKVLFRQILLAMAYCHARQVAHRDMKLENLLLTADKRTVKVCDFGLAKNVTESATSTIIGTGKYVAPEVLGGDPAGYDGFKADIWSCGVCLYCMVECAFPFGFAPRDGVGGYSIKKPTARDLQLQQDLKAAKYPLKAGRTPEYVAFLKKLLCPDVASRYTAAQALKDPWLMCDDWTAEMAQEAVASFQGELPAVVPGYYASRYAWLAKVDELTGVEEGTPPEPDSSDDEEAAM